MKCLVRDMGIWEWELRQCLESCMCVCVYVNVCHSLCMYVHAGVRVGRLCVLLGVPCSNPLTS